MIIKCDTVIIIMIYYLINHQKMKTMPNFILRFFQRIMSIFTGSATSTIEAKAKPALDASKASTVITYSDTLIPSLKDDHQALISLYGQISYYILSKKYDAIQSTLNTLKVEFNRHIMQENVSFYCYLEQYFADNNEHLETIKFYRKEMNGISHAFIKFIKKWQTTPLFEDNLEEFKTEYDAIGEVLAQRINSEEDHLYTLYRAI